MCPRRGAPRVFLAALVVLGLLNPAAAQAAEDDQLFGYSPDTLPLAADADWVDPAIIVGLNPDELAPAPDFAVETLHNSTVFASGIDWVPVEDDMLEPLVEHHVRVLQVIDTLDREVDGVARTIRQRRPQIAVFNSAIEHEHAEEARLAREIATLNKAIAEFAVRAFISEDELDTALTTPDTNLSETRVVSDEVREDQFTQIENREAELAERQLRRAGLEEDLRLLRSELRVLRRERLGLLSDLRSMEDLAEHTAATYQQTLHDRLELFVVGTDIPLVALNAYVIAERTQEVEDPNCQIRWWMLAGIGKIESIHGHFGASTLDVNGDTTDQITGPALDGRILEGAEFLVEGVELPEATDQTGAIEIELPPAPESAATNIAAGAAAANTTAPVDAPLPIIKRLALIKDSDGGRLDGDSVYDRAVGPMQFIPQTWRAYETDGNLDEEADPQNIYDAALASARYLCAASGSMATKDGQQTAYFSYNHDQDYSDDVAAAADRYRRRVEIPAEPVGDAHPLGVANPDLLESSMRALETSGKLEDPALPDW